MVVVAVTAGVVAVTAAAVVTAAAAAVVVAAAAALLAAWSAGSPIPPWGGTHPQSEGGKGPWFESKRT